MIYSRAVELASLIRTRRLSPVELMRSVLDRIDSTDRELNAFCTVCADKALEDARAAETAVVRRQQLGPLHGLPVAIKDLIPTAGIRTTLGSTIFADHVPDEDALVVERLKAAGAIVVGKTNTPEFAAGGHTFNLVCGTTRNPWAPSLTSGGSSGGSAVALAAGMVPLAEGSDLGGSLRIPASFCGVVGFRTSPGLVPFYPTKIAWDSLAVEGPMARTVEDAALMLGPVVGPDSRVPISYRPDSADYLAAARNPSVRGLRVAWSPDLGLCFIDPEIRSVTEKAVRRLERLGARVEEAHPDLSGVEEVIRASRGLRMVALLAPNLSKWRAALNPDLIRDIENGLGLSVEDVGYAETRRTELWERTRKFMSEYDLLITPTVPIKPFPVEMAYPSDINGQPANAYFSWLVLTYAISIVGLPAISVPAGFTADGLPVGAQIVGQWRGEIDLLRAAAAFEGDRGFIAPPRFAGSRESRMAANTGKNAWMATPLNEEAGKKREALTARDVEELHRTGGRQLRLDANAFLTPLARDRAKALGVEIVNSNYGESTEHAPSLKACCETAPKPSITATSRRVSQSSHAMDGVTLVPALTAAGLVHLVDMTGAVVHSWQLPYPLAGSAYMSGSSLLCSGRRPDETRSILAWEHEETLAAGAFLKAEWDGRIVAETRFPEHHHDGKELLNGNVLLLCVERVPDSARGPGAQDVWADWLAEFAPDGALVWEWHAREHLPRADVWLKDHKSRWSGATSFAELPSGDIAIAFRNVPELVIIERRGGRILHRIAPPVVNEPQHVSICPTGNLLVVDAYVHQGAKSGRLVEISPQSGNVVWTFNDRADAVLQRGYSGAQRLGNGNTLISERGLGRVFEVSTEGEVVWQFQNPGRGGRSSTDISLSSFAVRYEESQFPALSAGNAAVKQQAPNPRRFRAAELKRSIETDS